MFRGPDHIATRITSCCIAIPPPSSARRGTGFQPVRTTSLVEYVSPRSSTSRTGWKPVPRSRVQLPPLAVRPADERVGLGGVGRLHLRRVPLELLADAVGDVAQVVRLGQPAGVFEVGRRLPAGLAGLDPLGVVLARRAGSSARGGLKSVELLLRQQRRACRSRPAASPCRRRTGGRRPTCGMPPRPSRSPACSRPGTTSPFTAGICRLAAGPYS